MFELSVACKYLLPRRRQLSVSIISIISVLVISLVVWLIVVFFSVTDGLEKSWIQKLTALTAPIRITPTEAYYSSYYHQIDSVSGSSGYNHKTIREKAESTSTDPYDPDSDEEIPAHWHAPDYNGTGEVKDLVKLAYESIGEVKNTPGIKAGDFELTGSQIHLKLMRDASPKAQTLYPSSHKSHLSHPTYLGNFEPDNLNLTQTLLPVETKDINNLLSLLLINEDPTLDEESSFVANLFTPAIFRRRLTDFFNEVEVRRVKAGQAGWPIPRGLIPADAQWTVSAIFKGEVLLKVIVPPKAEENALIQAAFEDDQHLKIEKGFIRYDNTGTLILETPQQGTSPLPSYIPVVLAPGTEFPARLEVDSIEQASELQRLNFFVEPLIQGTTLHGITPYRGIEIIEANFQSSAPDNKTHSPLWIHSRFAEKNEPVNILPKDPEMGDGLLLPKGFKEAGVLIGDRGYLTYLAPTASSLQEQRLPIYVAGFYDPGIIPIGGKFILANRDLISIIHDAHTSDTKDTASNGINIRFQDYQSADQVKAQLLASFKNKGISRYWKVETFREYEFSKEIMRELQSQKSLFTLIAVVIIVVACSNIVSMLIILVNDKKLEIGILRSMGASSKSIALIFGVSGALIGVMGSLIGILSAILTLRNLKPLMGMISRIQGQDLFNPAFYGDATSYELSHEALLFVMAATVIISLIAGIIPAIKACLLKPSATLRATG
jgi:lipoprotein-releasing system permease protein